MMAGLLFSTLDAGFALAQTTISPSPTLPPVVITNSVNTTTVAPIAGANSFTMAQARERIEGRGYTQVTGLAKDGKSIWRGHAMKNGKAVAVALDCQGNIAANQYFTQEATNWSPFSGNPRRREEGRQVAQ
jgi:hypothetical protein